MRARSLPFHPVLPASHSFPCSCDKHLPPWWSVDHRAGRDGEPDVKSRARGGGITTPSFPSPGGQRLPWATQPCLLKLQGSIGRGLRWASGLSPGLQLLLSKPQGSPLTPQEPRCCVSQGSPGTQSQEEICVRFSAKSRFTRLWGLVQQAGDPMGKTPRKGNWKSRAQAIYPQAELVSPPGKPHSTFQAFDWTESSPPRLSRMILVTGHPPSMALSHTCRTPSQQHLVLGCWGLWPSYT